MSYHTARRHTPFWSSAATKRVHWDTPLCRARFMVALAVTSFFALTVIL